MNKNDRFQLGHDYCSNYYEEISNTNILVTDINIIFPLFCTSLQRQVLTNTTQYYITRNILKHGYALLKIYTTNNAKYIISNNKTVCITELLEC